MCLLVVCLFINDDAIANNKKKQRRNTRSQVSSLIPTVVKQAFNAVKSGDNSIQNSQRSQASINNRTKVTYDQKIDHVDIPSQQPNDPHPAEVLHQTPSNRNIPLDSTVMDESSDSISIRKKAVSGENVGLAARSMQWLGNKLTSISRVFPIFEDELFNEATDKLVDDALHESVAEAIWTQDSRFQNPA